jgi:SAM-dependent methyltransferase
MHGHREVDRIADVYRGYARENARATRWAVDNPGNRAIVTERRRAIAAFLPRPRLATARVLEIGCGDGDVLADLVSLGARPDRVLGVDLLEDEIAGARARHPELRFAVANGEALDAPDGTFDVVALFTVFTSILDDDMSARVAAEVDRVLVPGGAVLWYDFRVDNPSNSHVRGVRRLRIRRLFPGYALHLRSVTVLPPLARRLGPTTPWLYPLLARVPVLRTHWLGLVRKPA